jgi:cytochrome c biogenesis protein CcmG, thiol:disulfide interchange protein DsbE
MLRFVLPLGLFIILVGLLAIGLKQDPRLVPSPLIGKPAPELNLPRLTGEGAPLLRQDLLGKVTLVNVWASWCVACRDEHAILLRLARERTLPILGLNYKDRREDALAWLATFGDPYTDIAFDTEGRAAIDWGVYGVPESFVVGPEGVIHYKHVGPLSWEIVQGKLVPLIQTLTPSRAGGD